MGVIITYNIMEYFECKEMSDEDKTWFDNFFGKNQRKRRAQKVNRWRLVYSFGGIIREEIARSENYRLLAGIRKQKKAFSQYKSGELKIVNY